LVFHFCGEIHKYTQTNKDTQVHTETNKADRDTKREKNWQRRKKEGKREETKLILTICLFQVLHEAKSRIGPVVIVGSARREHAEAREESKQLPHISGEIFAFFYYYYSLKQREERRLERRKKHTHTSSP